MSRILFVTRDGLSDPLGQSQILPYLAGLSELGHEIVILSCEKSERMAQCAEELRAVCRRARLNWHPIRFHRRPHTLSAYLDLHLLTRAARRLHSRSPFDLVHSRSYIGGLVGLDLKRRRGVPLLFDMRGFWPDEKVEGGSWPQSKALYRAIYWSWKRRERELIRESSHIVAVTHAAREQLEATDASAPPTVTVIPCCADFDFFKPLPEPLRAQGRAALGLRPDTRVLVYAGSVGGLYLIEEMLGFFVAFKRRYRDAVFMVLTPDRGDVVTKPAKRLGIDTADLIIRAATREQMPGLIALADLGVCLIRPAPSKSASFPTKWGEMLASGVPIIVNAGVGDAETIFSNACMGQLVEGFDAGSYAAALDRLDARPEGSMAIREAARTLLDLRHAVAAYDGIYRSLLPGLPDGAGGGDV